MMESETDVKKVTKNRHLAKKDPVGGEDKIIKKSAKTIKTDKKTNRDNINKKSKLESKSESKLEPEHRTDPEFESCSEIDDNIENKTLSESDSDDMVLNEDLLDLLEGMTDKLEQTTNMAEKIKLHSDIQQTTNEIKSLIDGLIRDVDTKIIEDPSNIFFEDLCPTSELESKNLSIMENIDLLDKSLDSMNNTDDLQKQVKICKQIQLKCQILKKASDNGDLIMHKCN